MRALPPLMVPVTATLEALERATIPANKMGAPVAAGTDTAPTGGARAVPVSPRSGRRRALPPEATMPPHPRQAAS